ncbi:uncharacterized protein LOC110185131 [Drosophila serrata]|uniref:uncharacterized protein LOC110185131 n=1 Tax=Drosophila serrata TaxID=7274 RepID=UPI000A1D2A96|nr:uncharacterized protein LOC110185131 [Drosophila serrata]
MATHTCTQFLSLSEISPAKTATTFTLDASHFGRCDLNLFIDSLETISKLEKERHERRQRRREQKIQKERMAELEDERCTSPTPSADEAADEPVMYLEAKCIPYAVSSALPVLTEPGMPEYYTCNDEAYSSASQSPRSSVTYCSCGGISSLDSDSAESGVCDISSPPPLRPRSQVITKPKQRSTRSRIISMVLKREYAKAPLAEKSKHCDHLLSDTISRQYGGLTTKSRRGIACLQGSPEERFLDKALRYLTL